MKMMSFLYPLLSLQVALAQSESEITIIVEESTPTGFNAMMPGAFVAILLVGAIYFFKFRKK